MFKNQQQQQINQHMLRRQPEDTGINWSRTGLSKEQLFLQSEIPGHVLSAWFGYLGMTVLIWKVS